MPPAMGEPCLEDAFAESAGLQLTTLLKASVRGMDGPVKKYQSELPRNGSCPSAEPSSHSVASAGDLHGHGLRLFYVAYKNSSVHKLLATPSAGDLPTERPQRGSRPSNLFACLPITYLCLPLHMSNLDCSYWSVCLATNPLSITLESA